MSDWTKVSDRHPPRGGRYEVRREDVGQFETTVCYGMHDPWWIPRTVDKFAPGALVIPFTASDEWRPVDIASQPERQPVNYETLLGAVARGWCHKENEHKETDATLATAIANEVMELLLHSQPERQPVSEQRFALPKHLVLQITTAYEQGFGHAFRDTLNNPYSTGSHEAEAWDRGREEGRKRNVIEQTEAQIECHGLDTPERVCFYEQEFYVLSNFSAFSINWKGRRFPTSEHAYHWEKFPQGTRDGELFVRDVIVDAESAHAAFKMAEGWRQLRRPDWDEIKVEVMREILRAKAMQHEYVRRKLLATGDRELVENSWRDDFWGWGPNRNGQNMLGKLWMEVRAELRAALAARETK